MDPSDIERYDRQIRLWGQHGQNRCLNSKICLINADSLGMEILKGLCLAGINSFTILDSHKLTHKDLGCIFIPHSKLGKGRGGAAKAMLLDINDGAYCEVYPIETYLPHVSSPDQQTSDQAAFKDDTLNEDAQFWKQFSCVIACGIFNTSQIDRLSRVCWSNDTPLIQCKSIGFYGCMKTQLKEHIVSDTHPEWKPANYDPNKPGTVMISTNPIYEEHKNKAYKMKEEDYDDDFITEYVCLMALDLFFSIYGRLPGHNCGQIETDISKLKDCVKKMIGKPANQLKTLDQCLYEVSRYGGAELHVTSAFMGGCIAQETIKLITNQYVPVDDTLVYNAMTATTRTFRFTDVFSCVQ